jgi:hypothetical protein
MGLESDLPNFGVKAGDFVLQPRFFLEGLFSNNFFRSDPETTDSGVNQQEVPVFSFHLRPGFGMFNSKESKVAMSLGIDADVQIPASDDPAVSAQTNVAGTAAVSVAFFPQAVFSVSLNERFDRQLWSRAAATTENANVNQNKLGADFVLRPGGGALEFSLSYAWWADRYDSTGTFNMDQHRMRFLGSWRFFPLTSAFAELDMDIVQYVNRPSGATTPGSFQDMLPTRIYLGVSGYITERLALLVKAGYGNSLQSVFGNTDPADFSMFVGLGQVSFRFTPKTMLHVGVSYDFDPVAWGAYRDYVRTYLSFEQQVLNVVLLHLDFGFDHRMYKKWTPYPVDVPGVGSVVATTSSPERVEEALNAGILADFNIHRIFGLSVGYRFDGVVSDYTLSLAAINSVTHVSYLEHRVFLTLNLRY